MSPMTDPLLIELRSRDCEGLQALLGITPTELAARISGHVEFNVSERMSVARWLGSPMADAFLPIDRFFGATDELARA